MKSDSYQKRESLAGRWLPAVFYSANIISWLIIGINAGIRALLFLVLLPLPALIIYFIRAKRKNQ